MRAMERDGAGRLMQADIFLEVVVYPGVIRSFYLELDPVSQERTGRCFHEKMVCSLVILKALWQASPETWEDAENRMARGEQVVLLRGPIVVTAIG